MDAISRAKFIDSIPPKLVISDGPIVGFLQVNPEKEIFHQKVLEEEIPALDDSNGGVVLRVTRFHVPDCDSIQGDAVRENLYDFASVFSIDNWLTHSPYIKRFVDDDVKFRVNAMVDQYRIVRPGLLNRLLDGSDGAITADVDISGSGCVPACNNEQQ